MSNFDLSDNDIHDNETPYVAWCAICAGPTEINGNGHCVICDENGERSDVSLVVPESVPQTSPRSIECPLCGADPGEYCYPDEEGGGGYNHAARVEDHEVEHGVIAARPRGRA